MLILLFLPCALQTIGSAVTILNGMTTTPQRKKTAVPRLSRPPQYRSKGVQVDTEKPAPQYLVDEEAIIQLMKTCPMCDRQCRCSKHTRGPYLIVYQNCYFCDFQRKWASQPETVNIKVHKAHKKKLKSNVM